MIKARFYVAKTTRFAYNPGQLNVELNAVGRGEENKVWATATPSGSITMTINNPDAATWFESRLGKDVLVDFSSDDDAAYQSAYQAKTW